MGYPAIIVAYLGRLNPIRIVLAGLLMALLYLGGEMAQMQLELSVTITVFSKAYYSFSYSRQMC